METTKNLQQKRTRRRRGRLQKENIKKPAI